MLTATYASFALNNPLAQDPALVPEFMQELRRLTALPDNVVVMADEAIVASPNFRRAFREFAYRPEIEQMIENHRIVAAPLDGSDYRGKGWEHFSFDVFQRWFNQCHLWKDDPKGDDARNMDQLSNYKIYGDVAQEEMRFFDEYFQRLPVESRDRDPLFIKAFMRDLDHPFLKESFRDHHRVFTAIARDIYPVGGPPEGIIRVTPYPPAGKDNIHARFSDHLKGMKVGKRVGPAMLQILSNFAYAKLDGVIGELVLPALQKTYGPGIRLDFALSPFQAHWRGILTPPAAQPARSGAAFHDRKTVYSPHL